MEDADFKSWVASLNEPCLFFDGASKGNPGPAGAGGIIKSERGIISINYSWGLGIGTNNTAEFCSLWQGLQIARNHGIRQLTVLGDSRILIKALQTKKAPLNVHLRHMFQKILQASNRFHKIRYFHVLRALNNHADTEANKGVELAHGNLNINGLCQRCDIP
jgi:ribonuclease HI